MLRATAGAGQPVSAARVSARRQPQRVGAVLQKSRTIAGIMQRGDRIYF